MRAAASFFCSISHDNFIGDKKWPKSLLFPADYPMAAKARSTRCALRRRRALTLPMTPSSRVAVPGEFSLRMLAIGIETPRVASLNETKKFQNTRGDSLDAKLARIQNAGLDISAGFIVGFDNDHETIFEDQFRFIQDNGILLAMVGMLAAVPKTPLFERLQKEGRLRLEDANCNIVPKQMTPAELQQGYWQLLKRLYTPQAFLDRYFRIINIPNFAVGALKCSPTRRKTKPCKPSATG